MRLYFLRHAPAELRHDFAQTGQPDDLRPITEKGALRTREMLNFFVETEDPVDLILCSPFFRCVQTADICKEFFPNSEVVITENLCPDHSAEKLKNEILNSHRDSVLIIGHEPDLGQFLSWLLFRQATDQFPFKKSGMAKVDLYDDGRTYLKWMVRPKLIG